MNTKEVITVKINAADKILGRLSTEIANTLRSKNDPNFEYNKINPVKVIVYNATKIVLTGKKENQKIYYRHSGYLGGLKETSYKKMKVKFPERIIYNAVKGMLPKNRLQKYWLKNLEILSGEINDK